MIFEADQEKVAKIVEKVEGFVFYAILFRWWFRCGIVCILSIRRVVLFVSFFL